MVACAQSSGSGITLTWRSNRQGSLEAAYLGACRVGYVQRTSDDWIWNTTLLRPEGTAWFGRAPTQDAAHEQMSAAVAEWVAAAGLETASGAAEECPRRENDEGNVTARGAQRAR